MIYNQDQLMALSETITQEDLEDWLKARRIPYKYTVKGAVWTTQEQLDKADEPAQPPDYDVEAKYIEPSRGKTKGWIYVVQMNGDGPVKIGYSNDEGSARSRVSQLQTGNPYPLEMIWLSNGNQGIEAKVHRILSAHRMSGEWFHPSMEVMGFLERVKEIGFFDAAIEAEEGWQK